MNKSERLSWRDPSGFVVRVGDRILRAVAPHKAEQLKSLIREPWMAQLIAEKLVPQTTELLNPPAMLERSGDWYWVEHSPLDFPCYPHEITALQLYDSGQLTLKIAIEAAKQGWVLKDASAWNVLHNAGSPVFVDMLSFDKQHATGTWIAYGQFIRHFILPLLVFRNLGITPPDVFLSHRDGISPEHAFRLLRVGRLMSRVGIELVLLPKLLAPAGGRLIAAESARSPRTFRPEISLELLLNTLRRLQRSLARLRPDPSTSQSVWKAYEEDRQHYTEADLAAKATFVRQSFGDCGAVLDLGCNAGEYSRLAVDAGKSVVAADGDHAVLSRLYLKAKTDKAKIMPVFLNIGRPTPAVGWQNSEIRSFLERSVGRFDCVLVLGLIHHLLVSERASLPMLVDLLATLNPTRVIIEWVDPADPKFRQLAGLNQALYGHMNAEWFEACMSRKFRLVSKMCLPSGTRVMYLWYR